VIILVNGPFGVGKTTVARVLADRLGAAIYDPERIGFARILSSPEGRDWRLRHLAAGVAALSDPYFGLEIRTDHKRPGEIAREICERIL
jgi:hypothetical protein